MIRQSRMVLECNDVRKHLGGEKHVIKEGIVATLGMQKEQQPHERKQQHSLFGRKRRECTSHNRELHELALAELQAYKELT